MGTADHGKTAGEALAARVAAAIDEIIARWEDRVRADDRLPQTDRQSTPALRDYLPTLLDQLAAGLDRGVPEPSSAVDAHALHRIRQGYDIGAVLRELVHLRVAIVGLLAGQEEGIEPACRRTVERAIDEVMIRAAAELDRLSTKELRREAAFRERFIAILGHDLRQPLNAVSMAAEMLASVPGAERLAARIGRSAARMEAMVHDLLDFSVARRGGTLPITRTRVDLRALVADAIGELQLARPDARLELDAPESQRGLWDGGRLSRVAGNLLGNALDHGAPGKPVRVSLRGSEDGVELAIHNENRAGPISPERMAHFFDPFAAGDASKGLGLGLFIACQVVKAHGGRIECVSNESGTTFSVHLPRR